MYLTRHTDLIKDVNLDTPIVIIGAGSIGSYATLAIAKLGFKQIQIVDDGIIEEENIAPQFFSIGQIGQPKVTALARTIRSHTHTEIKTSPIRIEDKSTFDLFIKSGSVIITAVDSMEARKNFVNWARDSYIIDPRMAVQYLSIYKFHRTDRSVPETKRELSYLNSIVDESETVQEACTNKATSFTSLLAGGLVGKIVLDVCHKDYSKKEMEMIHFDINNYDFLKI